MAFLGQEEQIREFQDRFKYLYAVLFIGMGILVSRMVYLQIFSGDKMRQYSEENRIKRVKIASPRGMIFDRNRTLLIDNRPAFDVEIIPQYLYESKQTDIVVASLSKLINVTEAQIKKTLQKGRYQARFLPIKIKIDLSRDEVAQIEAWRLMMPGVQVVEEIKRTNVYADIASHMLGYIGEVNQTELPTVNKDGSKYKLGDSIGKSGLEQRHEEVLRGVDGEQLVEVDALGRTKLEKNRGRVLNTIPERPAVPGKNLVLTIDQDVQLAAVKSFGDKIGSVVAINPKNGEIISMVSRPSFDPTEFSRGIPSKLWSKLLSNEDRPLRDKTLQDHYPPGSTFKAVTAIAGLEEGLIDENTTVHCGGSMRFGNRVYHCHKKEGHGAVNVVTAIAKSCDVFFYKLALRLKSVDDLSKWGIHLGLGKKTGINLAREVSGLMPTEEWKKKRFGVQWMQGESLSVAIGQGAVLTTTLQLANTYAAIANGGTLYRPFLVKEIETYDGQVVKEFKPEVVSNFRLKPKTLELIKQGLWGVVNDPGGTAYAQRLPGMDMVGKSGTVQLKRIAADKIYQKCTSMPFRDRHNGVFTAFAPANDPMIAVAVIGEHVCGGSSGAAPIARAVIKTYLEKFYPDIYGEKVVAARLKKMGIAPYSPPGIAVANTTEDVLPENEGLGTAEDLPTQLPPDRPMAPVLLEERDE